MIFRMKKWEKKTIQYHKATYVFSVFLFVFAAVALMFWMVRPRPAHLGVALVLLISAWNVRRKAPLEVYEKDPKSRKSIRGCLFGLPVALWVTIVFLSPLELAFPSHMPWEYSWEVEKMKETAPDRYYYFPDEIPEGAKNIVWKQYPGYLQGKAFKYLMFRADDAYIEGELRKYEESAVPASFDEESGTWDVSVYPLSKEIELDRIDDLQIYLLYKSDNPEEYPSAMGIMVDKEQDMICYFFE